MASNDLLTTKGSNTTSRLGRPERPVLFHELVSGSSVSSSSVGNNNETLELPVVDEGSDLDSMPELEDVPNLDLVEIPWWLIPNGVMVTF